MKKSKLFIVLALLFVFVSSGVAFAGSNAMKFGYRLTMTSMVFMQGKYWKPYGIELDAKLFSTGI